MITFVPYPSFVQCARVLDRARLGKQIIEAKEIYYILNGKESRWVNHPVVGMWHGYQQALAYYTECMVDEWHFRGYQSHMGLEYNGTCIMPWWIGYLDLHRSHRQNLTRKNEVWYKAFWAEKPVEGYLWPTSDMNFLDYRRIKNGKENKEAVKGRRGLLKMSKDKDKDDMKKKKMPMMPPKKMPMGGVARPKGK